MGSPTHSISMIELTDISRQCAALHEDWQRFYHMAAAPPTPDASQQQLAFIQLQSRLSCDYPILSRWRKGNFGLASSIGKLVAQAGTLEAFAHEARAGDGPLVREWRAVNDSIAKVRGLLDRARDQAKQGKPVALPKEIAEPKVREPLPWDIIMRRTGIVCAVLACGMVVYILARPFVLETTLFKWLDRSYTAWQLRGGMPGIDLELAADRDK